MAMVVSIFHPLPVCFTVDTFVVVTIWMHTSTPMDTRSTQAKLTEEECSGGISGDKSLRDVIPTRSGKANKKRGQSLSNKHTDIPKGHHPRR